jgi:hypothetical protein
MSHVRAHVHAHVRVHVHVHTHVHAHAACACVTCAFPPLLPTGAGVVRLNHGRLRHQGSCDLPVLLARLTRGRRHGEGTGETVCFAVFSVLD